MQSTGHSHPIPTNVITGFLGAGKTTAILHVLKHKPANEHWAVLVNEFGEVGIDGALIATGSDGVSIKEVPGGCMCCTSGVPMQVALNQIIQQAKPDRLLIEPTGLGHPKEVLSVLRGELYQSVLNVGATLCLLDARKLADTRYTQHETFNQQLLVADFIIANKSDQYSEDDQARLAAFVDTKGWSDSKQIKQVEFGRIDPAWLDDENGSRWLQRQWVFSPISRVEKHHDHSATSTQAEDGPIQTYQNYSQGFYAYSWVFPAGAVFEADKLKDILSGLAAERIKGVIKSSTGWLTLNWLGESPERPLKQVEDVENDDAESKLEIITTQELTDTVLTKQFLAVMHSVEALGRSTRSTKSHLGK